MKLVLVSPPESQPFGPPMSLVALTSYLRDKGVSVTPIDAGIEAIHFVVNPDRWPRLVEPILPSLRTGLSEEVRRVLTAKRTLDMVDWPIPPLGERHVTDVLAELRSVWTDEGFVVSKDGFHRQLAALNDALILASLRMYPGPLTAWGTNQVETLWRTRQVNPFLDYFTRELAPRLQALAPDLIAISLTYGSQVFYGVELIHLLRVAGVAIPIVVGGATFNQLCLTSGANRSMRIPYPNPDWPEEGAVLVRLLGFDESAIRAAGSVGAALTVGVMGEGERPLLQMLERLSQGRHVTDLPGLVRLDQDEGAIILNEGGPLLPGEDIPKADLAGLGIGRRYFTPIVMAPIRSSRGCYWGKCTFCDLTVSLNSRYRMARIDVVVDSIEAYVHEFGVELAFFCDEVMSSRMLAAMTREMSERGLFLPYFAMSRIEKGLLPQIGPAAECGLRYLALGLESACQRIVSLMNKGHTRDTCDALLDECAAHDVRAHFFVILGFPTETAAEAQETVTYLAESRQKLWGVRITSWMLAPGSYIMKHPDRFGIVPTSDRPISWRPDSFARTEGLDHRQIIELIRRVRQSPDLKFLVQYNAQEDYRAIVDMIANPPHIGAP